MVTVKLAGTLAAWTIMLASPVAADAPFTGLTSEHAARAAANYQKYCSLCHGEDRQGRVNDHAPSLRSQSLMGAGFFERSMAIGYGRRGTPMAGFLDEVGGPMSRLEIVQLNVWLEDQAGIDEPLDLPVDPVTGDPELGQEIYRRECVDCHGQYGEGGIGTALGNPAMLSLTSDAFLRYAIVNGRDGTPMQAYGERLSAAEIDGLAAFLRSRATGWAVEKPAYRAPPDEQQWILNPAAPAPAFDLQDGMYVSSADLDEALRQGRRMVLLDTRVMGMWQMAHIEGAVPLPYYFDDFHELSGKLPGDGTWIVTYCECPRAAAESVTRRLRAQGYANTAVLWEGIQGWVSLGYPVARGETRTVDAESLR